MKCILCNDANSYTVIHEGTRDNPNINVLKCKKCELVYLSSETHIKKNFYEKSGMYNNNVNVEVRLDETKQDDERRFEMIKNKIGSNSSLLDFGCGAGGFLKRVKEITNNVNGIEIEKAARDYIKKYIKIKTYRKIDDLIGKYKFDYITIFHVLEHLKNPIDYLKKMKTILNKNGNIIIEVPNADDALLKLYRCKSFEEFTYWSCHLYLFNNKTISHLISKAGYKIKMLKQIQRYPVSNHLYWLAKDQAAGHKIWDFLNSEKIILEYEKLLSNMSMCDTIVVYLAL
jgi:2-polyprenyl-3-methyl-5-hydroxy-6-metoxy-1,4-benzoquinol methylase